MTPPVTLITGTSRGIGRYLAEHYLDAGHRVVGCSRSEVDLAHASYRHVRLDITDEAAVKRLFFELRRDLGRLDHLVNNAATASMNHTLVTPVATWERVLATNTTATFLFSREAAKVMKARGFGRIVNFSTVAVRLKLEGEAAYVASKAAVQAMAEVLARELAGFGITINCVGPTPVDTDLLRGVPEAKIAAIVERQAVHRLGTPADVANVVDFFLRPESALVTGQTLFLGGV